MSIRVWAAQGPETFPSAIAFCTFASAMVHEVSVGGNLNHKVSLNLNLNLSLNLDLNKKATPFGMALEAINLIFY